MLCIRSFYGKQGKCFSEYHLDHMLTVQIKYYISKCYAGAGDVAQWCECLPGKHKVLSLIPGTKKKNLKMLC